MLTQEFKLDSVIPLLVKRAVEVLKERYTLETRDVIELVFEVEEPLHPGMGSEEGKLLVATTENGKPVILESSWRGALRKIGEALTKPCISAIHEINQADAIALSLHHEPENAPISHVKPLPQENKIVTPLGELTYEDAWKKLTKALNELEENERKHLCEYLGIKEEHLRETREEKLKEVIERMHVIIEKLVELSCPLCRLYGSPHVKSQIILEDTILESNIHTRTHVGINRPTGVRRENVLFQTEYVLPNQIKLTIIAENIKPGTTEARILATTLQYILTTGLTIGGMKTRGYGLLKLKHAKAYRIEPEKQGLKALVDYTETVFTVIEEYLDMIRHGSMK